MKKVKIEFLETGNNTNQHDIDTTKVRYCKLQSVI